MVRTYCETTETLLELLRAMDFDVTRFHEVSADGDQTHTGQLFFDPETLSAVYAAEPYAARGEPDQPNESDGIYTESGGVTVVAVAVESQSAAGSVTLGIQST